MGKKVAIVQSNYIPWKGYFDLIRSVDEFILYDDAQYTVRDWRNRNRIKTERGLQWLSIPVHVKGKRFQAIKDVQISERDWGVSHWRAIERAYAKAPFFKQYGAMFESFYRGNDKTFLSEVNRQLIEAVNHALCIHTKISFSMDYRFDRQAEKSEKLLDLCRVAQASEYLSGPAAKNYLDEPAFVHAGIRVSFFDYSDYPEYPQLFGPFAHEVTILDLLFNTGDEALRYMRKSSKPLS